VPSNFAQQTSNINHQKSQPQIATLKKQSTSSALHISIGNYASSSIGTISTTLSSILPTTPLRRQAKLLLLLLTTVTTFIIASKKKSSLLWPGTHVSSSSDSSDEYPLPPGSFGCPFIGYDLFSGTKDYGYMAKVHKLSRKMANTSKIFKSYTFGMPIVSITGMKNVKSALKKEFKEDGVNMFMVGDANLGDLLGDKSVLYENKSSTHGMLRRLAGSAMTPAAINDALPSIQEAANCQVDKLLQQAKDEKEVEMERIFTDYTLDLAWKQIWRR